MKKLVIVEPKKCEIIEVPTPEINDDQILVKIKYYGVCMSEHHAWEIAEKSNGIDEGLGHEPMGYVEKEFASPDTTLEIDVRGRKVEGKVVKLPFIKKDK